MIYSNSRLLARPAYGAVTAPEASDVLRRCLGDHLFDSLIKNKKIEWSECRQVTDYELKRYLPML